MEDCLFCKIINKELSSEIIYESKEVIAFKDVQPKASVHILVLPKKHIASINHLEPEDKSLVGALLLAAKNIAKEKKLKGYKIAINIGKEGGQLVDHLHLHLLGGKINKMP